MKIYLNLRQTRTTRTAPNVKRWNGPRYGRTMEWEGKIGGKMPQNGIAASRQWHWQWQWLTKQNKSRRLLAPTVSVCRCVAVFAFFLSLVIFYTLLPGDKKYNYDLFEVLQVLRQIAFIYKKLRYSGSYITSIIFYITNACLDAYYTKRARKSNIWLASSCNSALN